jgi:hypothetical protein
VGPRVAVPTMRGPVEIETGELPLYEVIYRVLRQHIANASVLKGLGWRRRRVQTSSPLSRSLIISLEKG